MSREKGTLLESALEGLDLSTKSKIHQMAREYQLSNDDPLFVVLAATGRLEVLVEQAPATWDKHFQEYLDKLDEWYSSHSEILKQWENESQERIKAKIAEAVSDLIKLAQQKEQQKQGKILISKSNLGTLIGVSSVFGALIVFFLVRLFPVQDSLKNINGRLNNTDIRLERIEKHLGISK